MQVGTMPVRLMRQWWQPDAQLEGVRMSHSCKEPSCLGHGEGGEGADHDEAVLARRPEEPGLRGRHGQLLHAVPVASEHLRAIPVTCVSGDCI